MSGAVLHHEVSGPPDASPPVLLLRPIGGTIALWGPFRARLAARRRVIACEARGIGGSPPATPTTTRGMARDVADLLDALAVDVVDVFGLSLGGMVATWLAIDRPDRVRRLVLASTPARGLALAGAGPRGLGFARCLARRSGEREACLTARALSPRFCREHPDRAAAILDEVRREGGALRALLIHAAAGAAHDARAALRRIRAPTLCLAGALDPLVGPEVARDLAMRLTPPARVEILEDTGHDLSLERPDELATRVARFLDAAGR